MFQTQSQCSYLRTIVVPLLVFNNAIRESRAGTINSKLRLDGGFQHEIRRTQGGCTKNGETYSTTQDDADYKDWGARCCTGYCSTLSGYLEDSDGTLIHHYDCECDDVPADVKKKTCVPDGESYSFTDVEEHFAEKFELPKHECCSGECKERISKSNSGERIKGSTCFCGKEEDEEQKVSAAKDSCQWAGVGWKSQNPRELCITTCEESKGAARQTLKSDGCDRMRFKREGCLAIAVRNGSDVYVRSASTETGAKRMVGAACNANAKTRRAKQQCSRIKSSATVSCAED